MSFGEAVRLYGMSAVLRRERWETQTVRIMRDATLWYRRFPQDIGYRWQPNAVDLCAEDWMIAEVQG